MHVVLFHQVYCIASGAYLAVDWPAWEYVPRGPMDAWSDRWAMRDFMPSLWTLGILGSGTPLWYGLPRSSTGVNQYFDSTLSLTRKYDLPNGLFFQSHTLYLDVWRYKFVGPEHVMPQ